MIYLDIKQKTTAMGLMAAIGFALNPVGFFVGRYAKHTVQRI